MKRRRFILKKYFDKYNDLKQKSDTMCKFKTCFEQKLSTLISARELVVFLVGTVDRNIEREVEKMQVSVARQRKFTLP